MHRLHCCAGFVTRRGAAAKSGPELSRGCGNRGLLQGGAAVSRSLFWPNPPPLSAHFPNFVSPIPPAHQPSALSFSRGSSLVLFLVPGVARDGGGWLWRDECCCCPLVAPWSLCSLTSSGLQPTARAAPAGKQGSHSI